MTTVLEPKMAECEKCPGWQVACTSDAEWRRVLANHDTKHAETAENIGELLYDDPSHTADREAVENAIRAVARFHNGLVDANKVRKQIPSWVNPKMTAAVYGAWTRRKLLVLVAKVPSTDTKGRNSNKDAKVYRLRSEAS